MKNQVGIISIVALVLVVGSLVWLNQKETPLNTDVEMQTITDAATQIGLVSAQVISEMRSTEEVTEEVAVEEAPSSNSLTAMKGAEDLPKTEQASLWTAFSEARREIRPLTAHQKTMPENEGVRYLASNPNQRIRAQFLDDGVRLLSGYAGRDWQVVVSMDGANEVLSVRQQGTQLEYLRNGLVEWYDNKPEGLEHGYIVQRKTSELATRGDQLRIPVRIDGLEVQDFENGSLQFVNKTGEPVLSYSKLKVWDANGRVLASSMEPTTTGLNLLIADAGAVYPITIDPLIASLETKLVPQVMGSGYVQDYFGYSVSISGNTALIGAHNDDDGGNNSGSAYVFMRNGTNWSEQARLTAFDAEAGDWFGISVSVSGDIALVGAAGDGSGGYDGNSGSAYVFVRSGNVWSEQARLSASDAAESDYFGIAVSVDGDTALIGADRDDDAGNSSGSAYVFARNGTNWSEQAKLTASDAASSDAFGTSVSLSGDTALVGAPSDDDAGSSSGSAYMYARSGTNWSEQAKLTASDAASSDWFGYSVCVDADTALVGAYRDDDAGSSSGSAYVFVRSGLSWSEQDKLTASDAASGDYFGYSVSVSGSRALVGAPYDDDAGSSSGSAYMYARSGTNWSEQTKLTASNAAASDWFGSSVSVDVGTALVGAYGDDYAGNVDAGSSSVFVSTGANWVEQAKLSAGDSANGDWFGNAVSVDGDTALIGASGDADGDNENSGSAYVFVKSGSSWSQQAKLTASDPSADDEFGTSVSVSGNTALVGAYKDDSGTTNDMGSAYVFMRSGTNWSEQAKLTASDADARDYFGFSVSVSDDTALVGAYFDEDAASGAGSAYVFVRSGTIWAEQTKLLASDAAAYDFFGYSVSVDADTALIGAQGGLSGDFGSAYVFVRNGTSWSQQVKLTASDESAEDHFGRSVSVDADTVLVGAYGDDSGTTNDMGSAYVFVRSGTSWSEQAKLTAGDAAAADYFGYSVSVSDDTALIGAYQDDDSGSNSGSAYVFTRSGPSWIEQGKFTASDAAASDRFGRSVSVDADTFLVGAYTSAGMDQYGWPVADQGSAYIYTPVPPGEIGIAGLSGNLVDGGSESFGNQAVGISKVLTFSISNEAPANLTGLAITKDGIDEAAFAVGSLVTTSLADGESTTFRVTYTPPSVGNHTAALHITSNDPDENPFDITLTGTGLANSDADPGSDTWETTNGFDPNVDGDVMTLDSDGDGDPDIWELFQGTDRNGSGESYGFQATGVGAGEALTTQYRRSTTQSAVTAQYVWTCGLVDCSWYYHGESDGAVGIEVTETVVGSGPGYEIVEISAQPVTGSPDTLFFTLELAPNE